MKRLIVLSIVLVTMAASASCAGTLKKVVQGALAPEFIVSGDGWERHLASDVKRTIVAKPVVNYLYLPLRVHYSFKIVDYVDIYRKEGYRVSKVVVLVELLPGEGMILPVPRDEVIKAAVRAYGGTFEKNVRLEASWPSGMIVIDDPSGALSIDPSQRGHYSGRSARLQVYNPWRQPLKTGFTEISYTPKEPVCGPTKKGYRIKRELEITKSPRVIEVPAGEAAEILLPPGCHRLANIEGLTKVFCPGDGHVYKKEAGGLFRIPTFLTMRAPSSRSLSEAAKPVENPVRRW